MNVIILSAGRGTRLQPLTKNKPKALIEFEDGETILDKQLKVLTGIDSIDSITVVVGYQAEMIEEKIQSDWNKNSIKTVYNPFVEHSDNLVSLWLALRLMKEDVIITNGDNLFETTVIEKLLTPEDDDIYLTIDYKDNYDSDDMRVELSKDNKVKRVSKSISDEQTHAESIGIARLSGKKSVETVTEKTNELVRQDDEIDNYWLKIFTELSKEGIKTNTVEVEPESWYEFDFHSDKELFNAILSKNNTDI